MQADMLFEGKRNIPTDNEQLDLVHATYKSIMGQVKARESKFVEVGKPNA